MSKKVIKRLLMVIIVVVVLCLIAAILLIGNKNNKQQTIGCILPGDRNEVGFNGVHYMGISSACENLNLNLKVYDNISEQDEEGIKNAVESMHKEGIKVVFLCSYGYVKVLCDDFAKYPDITFYGIGDYTGADNYYFYFPRLYQARYISGMLAGLKTKTNMIGYVAAKDNSEVRRGINAFAIGARKVNPDATIYVMWTNSWDDGEKERANAEKLIKSAGVDVLAYHANRANVVDVAEEAGIYSIFYNTSPSEDYSDRVLTSTEADWTTMYETILKDSLVDKENKKSSYWLGIENDVIVLNNYSPLVTKEDKAMIDSEIDNIRNGQDVFSNLIIDNEGNTRCNYGEIFSDEYLMNKFDWFVDGVVLYE